MHSILIIFLLFLPIVGKGACLPLHTYEPSKITLKSPSKTSIKYRYQAEEEEKEEETAIQKQYIPYASYTNFGCMPSLPHLKRSESPSVPQKKMHDPFIIVIKVPLESTSTEHRTKHLPGTNDSPTKLAQVIQSVIIARNLEAPLKMIDFP